MEIETDDGPVIDIWARTVDDRPIGLLLEEGVESVEVALTMDEAIKLAHELRRLIDPVG